MLHTPSNAKRRILSLWFPRLDADRVARLEPGLAALPLAVVQDSGNQRLIGAASPAAEAAGITPGQSLSEAMVLCPTLVTRQHDPGASAIFLSALRRWAGKFSPWVAEEPPAGLMIDLTGCAHLFGGEAALLEQVEADCTDLGLSVRAGIADTAGAAWGMARYAGTKTAQTARSGDAIDQEARATRSRAGKRHWTKGGDAAPRALGPVTQGQIIAPGATRQALTPLPVAALRVPGDVVQGLARLGLYRIGDVLGVPRAGLARRFGPVLVRRLDQALGVEPEPITPARAPLHFATRLSLPDPVGLEQDLIAGLDRLLPPLCEKLRAHGRGARRARLELSRVDGDTIALEVGLARPADHPDTLRPLFAMKLDGVDVGFGIDRLRLSAPVTEPLHATEHKGGLIVAAEAHATRSSAQAMADLIARIGARIGLEAITREHPTDSHIPEKTSTTLAAAWSEPAAEWPRPSRPRPLVLFRPEPVNALPAEAVADADTDAPDAAAQALAPAPHHVPPRFRWRGRIFDTRAALGPERIAPEWWLDDRDWRSGVRDYWRVTTRQGETLWLYYGHGASMSGGWFAQGIFN